MGRYFIVAVMVAAIGFVGYQIFGIMGEYGGLSEKMDRVKHSADKIKEDNSDLKERIEYLSQPENLIKEIKSKFNYRFPDEQTIIVAPKDN
jgi:hypothetical protein